MEVLLDKNKTLEVTGSLRQFSIDFKNIERGWLILSSDEGEYFVQQNSNLLRAFFPRGVYKIKAYDESLISFDKSLKRKKNTTKNLCISIIIVAILRPVLKNNIVQILLAGNFRGNPNFFEAILNIFLLNIILIFSFIAISMYRKRKFSNQINKIGKTVEKIGTLKTEVSLGGLEGGVDGTNKIKVVLAYLLLLIIFIIPLLIIMPIYIQIRGLSIAIILASSSIFFNGNYVSDEKIRTYKIQMKLKEGN